MTKTCEYSKLCRNKPSHRILTKHGDFSVCRKHAKEAETNKDVRYIVPLLRIAKESEAYTHFQCNNCHRTYRKATRKWYAPHPKVHTVKCPSCKHNKATAVMYTK